MFKAVNFGVEIIVGFVALVLIMYFGSQLTKRYDIVLNDFTVISEDEILLDTAVSSSAGYTSSNITEVIYNNRMYLTFHSTIGINNKLGSEHLYEVYIPEGCYAIYFAEGKDKWQLVLEKGRDGWVKIG